MIPRSITLRGFLCYKDEQIIDLNGRDLWVFAGRNGSGKSSVFDAITFALFKEHRGTTANRKGTPEDVRLIHNRADDLFVCFEFETGAERYRIVRTVTRKGDAACGVHRHDPQPDGTDRWPAVPETQSVKGLERWVHERLGLAYETFTASSLLLQGQSDRLLSAKGKDRFDILAGIVNLDRYKALHKRADTRRLAARADAEMARKRRDALTVVTDDAIDRADAEMARKRRDALTVVTDDAIDRA